MREEQGAPIRVAIIEDDPSTCDLLQAFLRTVPGVALCGVAHNGEDGLELIDCAWPDLVLLDIVMPRLNGLGVLKALGGAYPRPHVVVLSGVGSDQIVQQALGLGADYYMLKPVRLAELAEEIHTICAKARSGQTVEALAAWLFRRMEAPDCLGFGYAAAAAAILADAGSEAQLKQAYLQVAQQQCTSYECVEKNIRTLVKKLHAAGSEAYRTLMGSTTQQQAPTNGIFLRKLAEKLRET